jgi:hypothetical protein
MNGAKDSAGRLQHRLPTNDTVRELPMLPQTHIIAFDSTSALEAQRINPEVTGCSQIIRTNRDPVPGS